MGWRERIVIGIIVLAHVLVMLFLIDGVETMHRATAFEEAHR